MTYDQLVALTENDAADEAEDLDYKLMYESGEEGAEDIAVDIATAILTASHFGSGSRVYGVEAQEHASGQADFLLDDLADDGQPLAAATARLASDLFHAFNTVGTLQVTREGVLQRDAWGSEWPSISRWAAQAGIPTNPPLELKRLSEPDASAQAI